MFKKVIHIKNLEYLLSIDKDGRIDFYQTQKSIDPWTLEENVDYALDIENDTVKFPLAVIRQIKKEIEKYILINKPEYLFIVPNCDKKFKIYKKIIKKSKLIKNYNFITENNNLYLVKSV